MPGKMENANSYRYISSLQLLREVAAAEETTQAAIAAVAEEIKLGVVTDGGNISIGHSNVLTLGVLLPAAVSAATVKVFVNMKGDTTASNYWAEAYTQDITVSTHITLSNIYPTNTKVMITAMTGAGSVEIVYGRTL